MESAHGHTIFKNDAKVRDYIETIQFENNRNSDTESEEENHKETEQKNNGDKNSIINYSEQLIKEYQKKKREGEPDFSGKVKIQNANFEGVDLSKINLNKAELKGANFKGANLERAKLNGADLRGSNFEGAVLKNAELKKARLEPVNLKGVEIKEAKLSVENNIIKYAVLETVQYENNRKSISGSKLTSDEIKNKKLAKANFKQIVLEKVSFDSIELIDNKSTEGMENTNLVGADLEGAHLNGADFTEANMEGCSLKDARLKKAKFVNADLRESNLEGAYISGANLRDANLENSKVADVCHYKRWFGKSRYRGIKNINTAYGNSVFKEYARDQDYLETFQEKNCWYKILYLLWFLSSNCGRSLTPFSIWAFMVVFIFGLLFSNINENSCMISIIEIVGITNITGINENFSIVDCEKRKPTWFTPFYCSIITFTTFGFGDVIPKTRCGEILVVAEVIIGYLMLGLLLSILINKFSRRDR